MNDAAYERMMIQSIRADMQRTNPIHEIDDGDIVMNIVTIDASQVAPPSIFLRRQAC